MFGGPGGGAGPDGRGAHGRDGTRATSDRSTRCTPTSSAPATPSIPILYQVDRIRDGRSFTTRRVAAIQTGEAIFHLSASFHVHEDGVSHQEQMPDVPDPETLPTWTEVMAPYAGDPR